MLPMGRVLFRYVARDAVGATICPGALWHLLARNNVLGRKISRPNWGKVGLTATHEHSPRYSGGSRPRRRSLSLALPSRLSRNLSRLSGRSIKPPNSGTPWSKALATT